MRLVVEAVLWAACGERLEERLDIKEVEDAVVVKVCVGVVGGEVCEECLDIEEVEDAVAVPVGYAGFTVRVEAEDWFFIEWFEGVDRERFGERCIALFDGEEELPWLQLFEEDIVFAAASGLTSVVCFDVVEVIEPTGEESTDASGCEVATRWCGDEGVELSLISGVPSPERGTGCVESVDGCFATGGGKGADDCELACILTISNGGIAGGAVEGGGAGGEVCGANGTEVWRGEYPVLGQWCGCGTASPSGDDEFRGFGVDIEPVTGFDAVDRLVGCRL